MARPVRDVRRELGRMLLSPGSHCPGIPLRRPLCSMSASRVRGTGCCRFSPRPTVSSCGPVGGSGLAGWGRSGHHPNRRPAITSARSGCSRAGGRRVGDPPPGEGRVGSQPPSRANLRGGHQSPASTIAYIDAAFRPTPRLIGRLVQLGRTAPWACPGPGRPGRPARVWIDDGRTHA